MRNTQYEAWSNILLSCVRALCDLIVSLGNRGRTSGAIAAMHFLWCEKTHHGLAVALNFLAEDMDTGGRVLRTACYVCALGECR
jgi:hypothetical protein